MTEQERIDQIKDKITPDSLITLVEVGLRVSHGSLQPYDYD